MRAIIASFLDFIVWLTNNDLFVLQAFGRSIDPLVTTSLTYYIE